MRLGSRSETRRGADLWRAWLWEDHRGQGGVSGGLGVAPSSLRQSGGVQRSERYTFTSLLDKMMV